MKKFLAIAAAFAGLVLLPLAGGPALAQNATVVSSCAGLSVPTGYASSPLIINSAGLLCDAAAGTGASSQQVQGTAAAGAATVGNPVLVAGSDGTNARSLSVDGSGHPVIVGNIASASTDSGNPIKVGGVYNSTLPTFTTGQRGDLQITSRGATIANVTDPTGNSAVFNNTVGDARSTTITHVDTTTVPYVYNGTTSDMVRSATAANATAGTGLLGAGALCKYNASLPTYTDGQYGNCQAGVKGNVLVSLVDVVSGGAIASQGTVDGDGARNGLTVYNRATLYNGATQDMAFTCANSAVVNVTAAATTQIVALSAAKVIRVCSLAISMSAAGTAKVVYGTGSNCGTGTTDLTGAMTLATGIPLAMSAPEGGSLLRTASANALCVTAVTGNVTGFLTYAQY